MAPTEPVDEATARAWRLHDPRLPPLVDRRELARRLRGGSLPRALRRRAYAGGERTLIGVDDQQVSLAVLARQVDALASHLASLGVREGSASLLAAPNSLDFIRCYLALLTLRSPVVLSGPDATATELRARMVRAEAAAAITGGQATDTVSDLLVDDLAEEIAESSHGSTAGGDPVRERPDGRGTGGVLHLPVGLPAAATGTTGVPLARLPRSGDVAIGAFTSGTTGEPKMAPLRHGDVQASIRGVMSAWRWMRRDVVVHALPMHHQHGLGALHASVLSGSSLHCLSRFDPEQLIDEAKRRSASILLAVPAIWERIVATHPTVQAPALRLAISGSAPLPAALFERIQNTLGMPPLERYGTTESGLNISNLHDGARRPGGVGFPLPGVEISIDEATGELSVRGPQLFGGYAGQAPLAESDWFATGDQAEADPATGAVTIVGRLKDIIITGGMNVHPTEVEEALAGHPAVDAVAVAGVPSTRWGEEVTAFVVSSAGFDPDELRRWARRNLSAYKVPKRLHPVAELPRNHMGKVLRSELIERGAALAARRDATGPAAT